MLLLPVSGIILHMTEASIPSDILPPLSTPKLFCFAHIHTWTSAPPTSTFQVMELITRGILINIVGMGSTLIGISTLVGLLVAKTLSNASVNPFMASAAGGYNPVLALDVFLVQAATNTLLGHFLSLLCSLWLLNVVGEGRGLRFQVA